MARDLNEKLAELSAERRRKIELRATALVAEEMSLRELRRAFGRTQAKLAADLGVGQDTISRFEQRRDMLLSTLRDYIGKMGGKLVLTAQFPDRAPILIKGFADIDRSGIYARSTKPVSRAERKRARPTPRLRRTHPSSARS